MFALLFLKPSCICIKVRVTKVTYSQAGVLKCNRQAQKQLGNREWWGLGQNGELILISKGLPVRLADIHHVKKRIPVLPEPLSFQEKYIYMVLDEFFWLLNDGNEF